MTCPMPRFGKCRPTVPLNPGRRTPMKLRLQVVREVQEAAKRSPEGAERFPVGTPAGGTEGEVPAGPYRKGLPRSGKDPLISSRRAMVFFAVTDIFPATRMFTYRPARSASSLYGRATLLAARCAPLVTRRNFLLWPGSRKATGCPFRMPDSGPSFPTSPHCFPMFGCVWRFRVSQRAHLPASST